MSRDVREYCIFPSSSRNETRDYSGYRHATDQTQNSNNLTTTHSEYSTHEDPRSETFQHRPYPMETGLIPPSCCVSQGLPIYKRLEDPSITSAPVQNRAVAATKSDCCCKASDYRQGYRDIGFQKDVLPQEELNRINLPPGGHKSFPRVTIPMRSKNLPAYQGGQQINPILPQPHGQIQPGPTLTTANVAQASSQLRNVINRTTPTNTGKNVIKPTQYQNRQRNEAVGRPLGFDPYLIAQNYGTVNRPIGFEQYLRGQNNEPISRPLGFEGYQMDQNVESSNRPMGSRRPIGFEQYVQTSVGRNVTRDRPPPVNTTVEQPFSSEQMTSDYQTVNYPDLGPWRNFEIPKEVKRMNIAPSANKTYPTRIVPLPSRNYSTYDKHHQPVLNVKEVAMHHKKAPRFHSTPTEVDFPNEGTTISSVWGQDLDSMRQTQSGSYVDSSVGWSQGVRMDSFNVIKSMTPSPKNVKVKPRLNTSYMPATTTKRKNPAFQKTHTYIQNPYAHMEYLSKLPYGALPVAEGARMRGQPLERTYDSNIRTKRGISPVNKQAGLVPTAKNENYCAPCGNATFSGKNIDENASPKAPDKTIAVLKRSEEADKGKPQAGNDFCTVLEIRTPCGNNPNHSDKPLQLSINVTCADPSLVVTPDKRYNVISHSSAPEVSAQNESSNKLDDVPSDCDCD